MREIGSNGEVVVVVPAGTQLVACLRETEAHEVFAIYEKNYRAQVYDFTLPPVNAFQAVLDPLIDGNYEYKIYHLGDGNPTEFFRRNFRLSSYWQEDRYFEFAVSDELQASTGMPSLLVWHDENDIMDVVGHHYYNKNFGYYTDNPIGGGDASTFISPLATLRNNDSYNDGVNLRWATMRFSHFIMDGEVVYKGAFYDEHFDTTLQVSVPLVGEDETDTDPRWYGLNGVKFDNRPTIPGIYIHQGKKIVVK